MKTLYLKSLMLFGATWLIMTHSCKPKDHDHHEHDAIVRVQLLLTDTATKTPAGYFVWSDPDGIGGNNPTQIDTIKLNANSVYSGTIRLYAQHDGHEHEITSEIVEQKNDHLFVYKNIFGELTIYITDRDDKNLPVGLQTIWVTGNISGGQVNIVLRHQPGVKNGTEAPGDTDIDVVFPLVIK
ncbi:MAG: hypothetical protein NZM35_07045 [Chitinophagales bacterium]|nr:hypothetical protein [Chitinophagales bacterium]MDW8419240.1 hypothetical protein [Chitinophagales bacterium]